MAVLVLAGLPIWRLTHRRADAAHDAGRIAATADPQAPAIEVQLRIEFTSGPRTLRILHVNEELCAVENAPPVFERAVIIPWPAGGVDLRVQIGWAEGAPLAAARVTLTTPDGAEHARSIWGTGPTDEVVTFP